MLDGAQVIVDYLIREEVPYAFAQCSHGDIQFIGRCPGTAGPRPQQAGDRRALRAELIERGDDGQQGERR
jgi:hypothetical protein